MAHQSYKVPISNVAVNCFEDIDHINLLHIELTIYGGGFEPLISSCADLSYLIQYLLFFNLIYQSVEMIRWLLLHLKMCSLKMFASS